MTEMHPNFIKGIFNVILNKTLAYNVQSYVYQLKQVSNGNLYSILVICLPSQHKNVGPTKAIGRHRRRFGVGADVGCSSD